MHCSPDQTAWSLFEKRQELDTGKVSKPEAELASALRKSHDRLSGLELDAAANEKRRLDTIAGLGVLVHHLERSLDEHEPALLDAGLSKIHDHLKHIKDRFRQEFQAAGINIIAPVDWPYSTVSELVKVESWLQGEEYDREVVIDVLDPIIQCENTILRRGRVLMGGPLPDERSEPNGGKNEEGDTNDAVQE